MSDSLGVMRAPFPWFGGKRKAAHEVWLRFGQVDNYVEPFFGSGAVLLGRPCLTGIETVNDVNGYVSNFWRAIKLDPEAVAEWANWPVNENDLHARHFWLVKQEADLVARLEGNPDFYDARIAGYWVWGICAWIGTGFCSGKGPWSVNDAGRLVKNNTGQGINRQLIHLGNTGRGINRKLIHLEEWFIELSKRFRNVRVASGDWSRVCGPSVTLKHGMTAVFLDPPYSDKAKRGPDIYSHESLTVAHDVREWAIANGDNPLMRIALCGYEGEHVMPESWSVYSWNAGQGYGAQASVKKLNGKRERIWFSPACETMRLV